MHIERKYTLHSIYKINKKCATIITLQIPSIFELNLKISIESMKNQTIE